MCVRNNSQSVKNENGIYLCKMELETLFALHNVNIRNHFLCWQTNFTEITNKPRQNPPQEVPRSSSSFSIRWHLQNSSGSFSFRLHHLELMGTNQILLLLLFFMMLWVSCEAGGWYALWNGEGDSVQRRDGDWVQVLLWSQHDSLS